MRSDADGGDPTQASLFGAGEDRIPDPPAPSYIPKPEDVRRRLHDLLATARAADRMPWDARRARSYRTIFPQMANWLPDDEADQLRFAFAAEMERLLAA